MKSFLSFLFCSLWFIIPTTAQHLSEATARMRASAFLASQRGSGAASKSISLHELQLTVLDKDTATYLYRTSAGDFVLLSADERLPEVMGYGSGLTSEEEIPDGLKYLADYYATLSPALTTRMTTTTLTPVTPLVNSIFSQAAPFNNFCPYYKDGTTTSSSRCPVGCIATAIEQLLNYYRYPSTLLDSLPGWSNEHYTIPTVPKGTKIDWDNILDSYSGSYTSAQAKAVAELAYWCGVAFEMMWAPTGSGTWETKCSEPLKKAFGYKYVKLHYADSFSPDNWLALIRSELYAKRPMMLGGYSELRGGHGFVVDGMDSDGLFHINWGWGGSSNGYFALDFLDSNRPNYERTPFNRYMSFYTQMDVLCLSPDSVEDAGIPQQESYKKIVVDSLRYLRPLDTQPYVTTRIWMHNPTADTVFADVQLLSFSLDSADTFFDEPLYVSLPLLPYQHICTDEYALFSKSGKRRLVWSVRDVAPFKIDTVDIAIGSEAFPVYTNISIDSIGENKAYYNIVASNESGSGWCSNYATIDYWTNGGKIHTQGFVLNLAPQTSDTIRVVLDALSPATYYATKIYDHNTSYRANLYFTTLGATDGITSPSQTLPATSNAQFFDLYGRRYPQAPSGIYIYRKNGKSTLMTNTP